MGRASDILDSVGIESILEDVAEGMVYRRLAEKHGVALGSLLTWLAREEFAGRYARAREARGEKLADEIMSISDDATTDTFVDPETGEQKQSSEAVQRSRLRVDSRKWLASKMFPRRYGEKIQQEVTGANGGPLQVVDPMVLAAMTEAEIEIYLSVAQRLSGVAAGDGQTDPGTD